MAVTAPYGTWTSPITADFVAGRSLRLSEPQLHQSALYWLEGRPEEKGRQVIVRKTPQGVVEDILPAPWNARSKAHEYGGGSYTVWRDTVYFINAADQQIYRFNLTTRQPQALTNAPHCRFADLVVDPHQRRLFVICEDHNADHLEPVNSLISLSLNHVQAVAQYDFIGVDSGHDFYSNPRLSPSGEWLTYLSWDHPNMPWDATQLWLRRVQSDGSLGPATRVAGSGHESLFQPQWSPSGDLFWVSDQDSWWNLYRVPAQALDNASNSRDFSLAMEAVYPMEAEFATPQWTFAMSTYGFLDADSIFAVCNQHGRWQALRIRQMPDGWQADIVETPFCTLSGVTCEAGTAAFIAASPTEASTVLQWHNYQVTQISSKEETPLGIDDIAVAQTVSFTSAAGTAHAFFYPPTNVHFHAPENTLPPVIVVGHGGPTGASSPAFNYKVQYWTQRGFAVLDVNYRGSTGYGRGYRQALYKHWGVVDVQDLAAAAQHATDMGWVHPNQRIVRGSSAGGFTVLAALTDSDVFDVGVSLYGISDLETLIADTHKFESRYLDSLVGPYPAEKTLYIERSPIHKVANIHCPMLVFQGMEDNVVPPQQAEAIVDAVKKRGLPVAYVTYDDEGHGFRQAHTIRHQLQAELYFYQQTFGLGSSSETEGTELDIVNQK